jgi:hypothetical protein
LTFSVGSTIRKRDRAGRPVLALTAPEAPRLGTSASTACFSSSHGWSGDHCQQSVTVHAFVQFGIAQSNFNIKTLNYFFYSLIYFNSICFLLTSNLFFFIIFYEATIFPIFLVLKNYGHYFKRTQASFLF